MRISHRLTRASLTLALGLGGACAPAETAPAVEPPLPLRALYAAADASVLEPAPDLEEVWLDVVRDGWHEAHPELETLLEQNRATLALLHDRIGNADGLAVPASAGYEPKLFQARRLANLLLLEGREYERARRHDEALASALAALRLAHRHMHEGEVPFLVAIIGQALQRPALHSIRDLVHCSRTSPAAWKACIQELAILRGAWPDLAPGLRTDADRTTALIEGELRAKGTLDDSETQLVLSYLRPAVETYLTLFLDAYRRGEPKRLERAMEERARGLESPLALLGALVSDERQAELSAEAIFQATYVHSSAPIVSDMLGRVALDMERVAIAARLYYVDHGRRPPDSLDDLIPDYLTEIPEDVFAPGERVRLARSGKHWWIYSVGPDRIDQGGLLTYSAATPEGAGDVLAVAEHRASHRCRPHQ